MFQRPITRINEIETEVPLARPLERSGPMLGFVVAVPISLLMWLGVYAAINVLG